MASPSTPGGGVLNGAGAQQENLFRRSDYFRHLNFQLVEYPHPVTGGVYTPSVLFFRGSEAENYPVLSLEDQQFIDCVAVAAIKDPQLEIQEGISTLSQREKNLLQEKIRLILGFGAYYGHDALVLSAFGCGAFKNPPGDVAEQFRLVLESEEFLNRFANVTFAIFDDHNSRKAHNPEGNVVPFCQVFGVSASTLEELR